MLAVSGLVHGFGGPLAVDGVDLDVEAGEIVGLVGRNGAGKTTIMRAIMGILRPLAGDMTWHGHPVGAGDRLQFGYMPEERGLYPQMRVLEQLAYFGELYGLDRETATVRAQSWLDRLGLTGREADKLVALPHGNQQRVQLAVALVHEPELLVLDEPFGGLDPTAVDALSGILQAEATRSRAILFSSHQLELVEDLCDRVVILEEGRVLASGTLDQLRERMPRRLRVKVDAPSGWIDRLRGVRVVNEDQRGVVLALEGDTDPQIVLRAAQTAGPVEHFGFETGSLVDYYRQLITR